MSHVLEFCNSFLQAAERPAIMLEPGIWLLEPMANWLTLGPFKIWASRGKKWPGVLKQGQPPISGHCRTRIHISFAGRITHLPITQSCALSEEMPLACRSPIIRKVTSSFAPGQFKELGLDLEWHWGCDLCSRTLWSQAKARELLVSYPVLSSPPFFWGLYNILFPGLVQGLPPRFTKGCWPESVFSAKFSP